jgi:hypothetical protein
MPSTPSCGGSTLPRPQHSHRIPVSNASVTRYSERGQGVTLYIMNPEAPLASPASAPDELRAFRLGQFRSLACYLPLFLYVAHPSFVPLL